MRKGSGNARTNLRSAPRSCGEAGAGCRPGDEKQGSGFSCGQAAQIRTPASGQPPTAVAALLRIDGHAGHSQSVEVTARRALRYLEFLRDFGGRHLPSSLEEQENGHETVGTHTPIFPKETGHMLTGFSSGRGRPVPRGLRSSPGDPEVRVAVSERVGVPGRPGVPSLRPKWTGPARPP